MLDVNNCWDVVKSWSQYHLDSSHGSRAWRRPTKVWSSLPSKKVDKKSVSFASDVIPSRVTDFTGMVDDNNDVIADNSTSLKTRKILSSEYRTMSSRTTLIAIQAFALGSYLDCWWWRHQLTWHHHLFCSAGDCCYLPYDIHGDICNVHMFQESVSPPPYRPNCYILRYDIHYSAYRCDIS